MKFFRTVPVFLGLAPLTTVTVEAAKPENRLGRDAAARREDAGGAKHPDGRVAARENCKPSGAHCAARTAGWEAA